MIASAEERMVVIQRDFFSGTLPANVVKKYILNFFFPQHRDYTLA